MGTEGKCFEVIERATHRRVALRKGRTYPDPPGEGLPYYLVRELSFLVGEAQEHPNVATPEAVVFSGCHFYQVRPRPSMSTLCEAPTYA